MFFDMEFSVLNIMRYEIYLLTSVRDIQQIFVYTRLPDFRDFDLLSSYWHDIIVACTGSAARGTFQNN